MKPKAPLGNRFFGLTDLILVIVLLATSGYSLLRFTGEGGNTTIIYHNNKKFATYNLNAGASTKRIAVGDKFFTLEIAKGKIRIVQSPCRHKICVKQGFIHSTNKQIVCVPYKILVRIENQITDKSKSSQTDAVTF